MANHNNTDTQAKIFEAQRERAKMLEAVHKLDLDDCLPTPPKSYTDIILDQFITFDEELESIKKVVRKLAPTDIPVLILGESGTGKELIAKALHGSREINKFIAINSAAIPENLLESEFFGHKKGAFTGAISDKRGLIEEADKGTLFLDEIGDTPEFLQAKLLRVLENGSFRKVGEVSQEIRVNIRLVSATNVEKITQAGNGTFRSDLFYRIAGHVIKLKPLRERPVEDVAMIVRSFCKNEQLAEQFLEEYKTHKWPGNIRELLSKIKVFNVLNG